jgi:phage head maturation protease
MNILGQIRGYANVFNVLSAPIGCDEPFRAIVRPGAFRLLGVIAASVMHGQRHVATTWDRSLRIWQDCFGLAVATPNGAGLFSTVAAINSTSIGLTVLKSAIGYDGDGVPIHDVTRAEIDHVTICDCGAFAGACCWVSGTPVDRMHPDIAAASRRWHLGRIAHDQKQADNRKMLAQYFAKTDASHQAAAPQTAVRRRPGQMLIQGMQPMDFGVRRGCFARRFRVCRRAPKPA